MSDTPRTPSVELQPGDQIRDPRSPHGKVFTLDRRKDPNDPLHGIPFWPGWWLKEGGGFADFVIDDPARGFEITRPDSSLGDTP
jgi:hypothetical protein